MTIKWNELKHKNSPERREANRQEVRAELERVGFGRLRQARQMTQVELAERLDVPQAAISRMERRADLLLSTLRHYIEGMGGQLELRAVFPEAEFLVEPLASGEMAEVVVPSKKTRRGTLPVRQTVASGQEQTT
jgi:ParB-like chromosome segregation protein Spo0J